VLNEHVRAYRWWAVSLGFVGIIVMLWPYLDIWSLFYVGSPAHTIGALCATGGMLHQCRYGHSNPSVDRQ
jgi:drug/metabolite transporter (DMT)-like permease